MPSSPASGITEAVPYEYLCESLNMPWLPVRTVENCPYRIDVMREGTSESARCGLLCEVANVAAELIRPVGRDVCEACCRSFPPSTARQNPVTASLLAELAGEIQSRGGVTGCDSARASQLLNIALRDLSFDEERRSTAADIALSRQASREPLAVTVPPPSHRCGSRVQSWAVGITTAPRRQPTLEPCLQSLRSAGWDSLFLFVDGPVAAPRDLRGVTTIVRETSVGAWANYWLSLAELLLRQPHADAYLLVQDDAVFDARSGLRHYLEQVLWPGSGPCLVSLYGSSTYTAGRSAGWSILPEKWVWGALAFVFPRELAKRFVTDPQVFEHRWSQTSGSTGSFTPGSPAGIDVVIGYWADIHGVPIWFPTPSLVQHIGHASSLWDESPAEGSRRADRFSGDGS